MIERVALWIFWIAMLLTAGSALALIWSNGEAIPERLLPTFFIVGFASFLIWAPVVVYRFLDKKMS